MLHQWKSCPLLLFVSQVIYVEAISNPLMEVPDLPAVVAFAKQHSLTSVIDATFATPINLQPALNPGFDVVIHSATKFLNGHSDLIAGVVAGSAEMVSQVS
jgi:cystathionine beta-lyase/cystathionine gamma-synthase